MTRLMLAVLVLGVVHLASADELDLRVMTFNIRYGTADDGMNAWDHRREMVVSLIGDWKMDVVGVQEALRFQLDEIEAGTGYAEIGVGRDDGRTKGEYSAILYRPERFGVAACGTFWLSDTPEEVASATWGNSITRICTWARLIDKKTGEGVYVFNTHFDHQSQVSREKSAGLIIERIRARAHDEPAILMGDFNAGESNEAIVALKASGLTDAFRAVHPEETQVGTFGGFDPARIDGEMIDHIFVTPRGTVKDAGIDRTVVDGRCPSDHFAVWAEVAWDG